MDFLEGDPDQPLVSGCLYHAEHLPPYELPAHKTRTLFKSNSSPGGSGYNELRIEDRKGQEQIYLHAQRDWDENIEHDQKIRVGHERHDTVEANAYSEFKAEEHQTIHLDRKVEAKLDASGVTVFGPLAKINAGGSPGSGSGIALKSPLQPGAADADKAGGPMDEALANQPLERTIDRPRMVNFSF